MIDKSHEKNMTVLSISRMTIHNGPGMRTLVQFKGCPLRCTWCSTPESQAFMPELGFDQKKCIRCLKCVSVCHSGAIRINHGDIQVNRSLCNNCGDCTKTCYARALWIHGKTMTTSDIVEEVLKDKLLFKNSGGGVTLSGGEPLADVDNRIDLCAMLKKENITIGVDTTGYVTKGDLQKVLPYIDFFLWDIKCINPQKHKELTGVDNSSIFKNLKFVSNQGIPIYLRCPIIPGMNDSKQNLQELCDLAKELPSLINVSLLPIHHLGRARYASLGRQYPLENVDLISDEVMVALKRSVESYGLQCTIDG